MVLEFRHPQAMNVGTYLPEAVVSPSKGEQSVLTLTCEDGDDFYCRFGLRRGVTIEWAGNAGPGVLDSHALDDLIAQLQHFKNLLDCTCGDLPSPKDLGGPQNIGPTCPVHPPMARPGEDVET